MKQLIVIGIAIVAIILGTTTNNQIFAEQNSANIATSAAAASAGTGAAAAASDSGTGVAVGAAAGVGTDHHFHNHINSDSAAIASASSGSRHGENIFGRGPDESCNFHPNAKKCAPDSDGNCPPGFAHNSKGNCHPSGPCPDGFKRHTDDESGKCFRIHKHHHD